MKITNPQNTIVEGKSLKIHYHTFAACLISPKMVNIMTPVK